VPDTRQGYVSGWVVKEEQGTSTVALEAGDEVSSFSPHYTGESKLIETI